MSQLNPKKEFTVNYPIDKVKEAIHKLNATEPDYYVIVSDSAALNQIRIHQKGSFLDMGYHVDFEMQKVSDNETKVTIEISRNAGTINTAAEMSIANNSMKSITNKFGAFLEGNVDPATGKPNLPQPTGCIVFVIIGAAYLIYSIL
jgi:carbon monoxide dehydrogenase subunit G